MLRERVTPIPQFARWTILTMLLIAASLVAVPSAVQAATLCGGLEATLVGTSGADRLIGTDGDDVIVGSGGADYIKGKGGNDVICANGGDDVVNGGPGKDVIYGGNGADLLWGKGGRDIISGDAGDDDLRGGNGPDELFGGSDNDALYGNYKDDYLAGGPGDDIIWGGSQVDTAVGGDGTDDCKAEDETSCERDPHDFSVERFYVAQSVPAADSADTTGSRAPTIKNRKGLFRVFVEANHFVQGASPEVVLHWRAGGDQGTISLNGPASVPAAADEGTLSKTFNAPFAEEFLENGMDVYVEVDPGNEYRENTEANNRWPESGWFDLDVTTMPSFDVTFVPINLNGTTATVTQGSAEAMLDETLRVHPIANYTIEIRDPYAFDGSTQQGWVDLLYELNTLRSNDGSSRTYYGVLPSPISPGIGGIGFIGHPVAHGLDDDHIVAHELGHTLNLNHAPCGGASGADPNYPYAGGLIGSWGYDIENGTLRDPASYKDVMSYCGPSWISDYNYSKVAEYREQYGFTAQYAAVDAGQTVLTLGGVITGAAAGSSADQVAAYGAPAAELRSIDRGTVLVDSASGPYRLIARDAAGGVVFSAGFEAYGYADGPGGNERLFAVSVAVDEADVGRVATVEIIERGVTLASIDADSVGR